MPFLGKLLGLVELPLFQLKLIEPIIDIAIEQIIGLALQPSPDRAADRAFAFLYSPTPLRKIADPIFILFRQRFAVKKDHHT